MILPKEVSTRRAQDNMKEAEAACRPVHVQVGMTAPAACVCVRGAYVFQAHGAETDCAVPDIQAVTRRPACGFTPRNRRRPHLFPLEILAPEVVNEQGVHDLQATQVIACQRKPGGE